MGRDVIPRTDFSMRNGLATSTEPIALCQLSKLEQVIPRTLAALAGASLEGAARVRGCERRTERTHWHWLLAHSAAKTQRQVRVTDLPPARRERG